MRQFGVSCKSETRVIGGITNWKQVPPLQSSDIHIMCVRALTEKRSYSCCKIYLSTSESFQEFPIEFENLFSFGAVDFIIVEYENEFSLCVTLTFATAR